MISREHSIIMEAVLYIFTMRKDPKTKKNEAKTGSLIKASLGYKAISLFIPNKLKNSIAKSVAKKKCKLKSERKPHKRFLFYVYNDNFLPPFSSINY